MKKAVFILLGQSNAVGHGIPMAETERITVPLKNVFGLHRKDNQSFDIKELIWRGYESGGMNLAEEQDHTWSLANCLARQWQDQIDAGADLPDLYIVQIAIGAQGVTEKYMWHPDREEKLIPGKLGKVDISLFPFACHIFSLLSKSLGDFQIIGLHWRGGEEDTAEDRQLLEEKLAPVYRRIFDAFNRILNTPPIVLHEIHCPNRFSEIPRENMYYINNVFRDLAEEHPNISLFDVRTAPFYDPTTPEAGIFESDYVHYTPRTNQWVAQEIIENAKSSLI
jgi:hypothetical protein